MNGDWPAQLRDLDRRLTAMEERHALHAERILRQAVEEAQRETFAKFGVDIEDPIALQNFQQGLLFNRAVHRGVNKALGAILLAVCGMIGTAMTMAFWEWFKDGK